MKKYWVLSTEPDFFHPYADGPSTYQEAMVRRAELKAGGVKVSVPIYANSKEDALSKALIHL